MLHGRRKVNECEGRKEFEDQSIGMKRSRRGQMFDILKANGSCQAVSRMLWVQWVQWGP